MTRMSKPHLLFLVAEDWYFVSHRLPLAKAALAAGYRVTVATRVRDHGKEIRQEGLDLIDLPFRRAKVNLLREGYFFFKLWAMYRRLKPDIAHHVAMKPVVFGTFAAKLSGRKTAIVNALGGLGYVFSSPTLKARLLRLCVGLLLKAALGGKGSLLILQNEDDKTMLVNRKLVNESSVRLIRGVGVEPSVYSPALCPDELCLVILPARLLRDKGVREFVEAARQLKREGLPVRFALVGEPDPENPTSFTSRDIEAWVAEGVVEAWGWRHDMAEVFAQAHIVCLPSYREGLPKVLVEAAASARAIVTTDVPGCRDVVRHDYNGLLVPARNAKALAEAIRALVLDPAKRHALGRNGRRRAETEFTASGAIKATLTLYRELLCA